MEERTKYFIFNKKSDYERGFLHNMSVTHDGICPEEQSEGKSVFISRLLDSREQEMVWHRIRIRGNEEQGISFRLSVYAGNQDRFIYQDETVMLDDFLRSRSIDPEDKKEAMSPWLQKQVESRDDVLLHDVRGRYLWIMIEMYWQHDTGSLRDIQIYFPRSSWIDYLPEIYREEDSNGFLERYLGIFQTIYEDFNEEIRAVPEMFDMDIAEGQYLAWLAGWIDIAESYIWSEEQLRRLLRRGIAIYKRRGTRQGVMEFVELYTGEKPYIVEHHQVRRNRDKGRREVYDKLYGNTPFTFTVLVREEVLHTPWQQKTLLKIIDDVKPAHMETRLMTIKPYIFLDQHSYLGVNSVLGQYSSMRLDGHSSIPLAVIGAAQETQD